MEGQGLAGEYITRSEFERAVDMLRDDLRERVRNAEVQLNDRAKQMFARATNQLHKDQVKGRQDLTGELQTMQQGLTLGLQTVQLRLSEIAGQLAAMQESSQLRDGRVAGLNDDLGEMKRDVALLLSSTAAQGERIRRMEITVTGDPDSPDGPPSLMKLLEMMQMQAIQQSRQTLDRLERLDRITGQNSRWIDQQEKKRERRRQVVAQVAGGVHGVLKHRAALLLLGIAAVGGVAMLSPEVGEFLQMVVELALGR